jgi:hypothetical protein
MWRKYFGRKAKIYGVDINPKCKQFEDRKTKVFIGDQEDRAQIATFEEMYPIVKDDGVFLIEDLHTSYWKKYGGGYKRPGTFIEYAKNLVDQLNAWYASGHPDLVVDRFTQSTRSMHFYDSIIVFEKDVVTRPIAEKTGQLSF